MLSQLIDELAPAAGILVLELNARRSKPVGFGAGRHAHILEAARGGFGLGGELRPPVGRGAVAATGNDQRTRAIRIGEAEMQSGKTAHRQADHVRFVDLKRIRDGPDVVARALLRVLFGTLRHVGGGIAARIECNAAISWAKMPYLRLPRPAVAGKFVDEDNRNVRSGFLEKEPDAIVRSKVGHAATPRAGCQ